MVKKLRRNFVISAMIAVTAVLLLIVGTINAVNYINSDNEAVALLEMLADGGGNFGSSPPGQSGGDPPVPPDQERNGVFGRDPRGRGFFTPETPYETRYFSVYLTDDGTVISMNTGRIVSVSPDEALRIAQETLSGGSASGYYGSFRYLIRREDNNNLCIFVDRSRALRSVTDFLYISLLVSLGAEAAIFVLLVIFSGFAVKPIAESYEKQKKFITDAGHELKTPLAVINSCNEVIEMEHGESKWTKGIAAQTERLSSLTKDLVALARMDENAGTLNFTEFPISETAEEILGDFSIPAGLKGVTFRTDITPGIIYKGDKSLIAKLFSIMADNSVKYTPAGGNISFSLVRKGKRIVFTSENTAEGISEGNHRELFDRFRRGDISRNDDTPGYGIGLSMAQSIVSAHGGKAEAYSRDGASLTITVRL